MYFSALKELHGQEVAILSYLDPLVAVIISVVVLGEKITILQLIGGCLILGCTLWNELKENCIWKWGALEGVYGYKITSKKNGNSIFLPATGYKENSVVSEKNSCGYYWLNMINPNNINQARSLYIDATKVGVVNCICYTGRCLRAVCP